MTALFVLLVTVQAALLLWASIHLSNVFLRPAKLGPFVWTLVTAGCALAIAHHSAPIDLTRLLCSPGDCVVLMIPVACVRVIVVNNENERIQLERDIAARLAAEAAKAARKAREAQQLAAAAAALESRNATRLANVAQPPPPGVRPPPAARPPPGSLIRPTPPPGRVGS
ncbi:MAG: hypothetical protein QG597_4155 [Actinomycetota bacterium]|nr:hypothetical protein [Actinomycetota bacterium]